MTCPCGSRHTFENCCAPFLDGSKLPPTAEALMRSRYVAYTRGDIEYLGTTLALESRGASQSASAKQWAGTAQFKGLKILAAHGGGAADQTGTVEFMAIYTQAGETWDHHEVSKFRKDDGGRWFFVEGESHRHRAGEDHNHHGHTHQATLVRSGPKAGRNDPCPCGSGKKFKKCCGDMG